MSRLLEIPFESYDPKAFADFRSSLEDYSPGNARALVWMAQLAYETQNPDKIKDVLKNWNLELTGGEPIVSAKATLLPIVRTRGIAAAGQDKEQRKVLIFAFAGTDPIRLADYVVDLSVGDLSDEFHAGFAEAAASVWDTVRKIIDDVGTGSSLLFAGHSLGGAITALTALKAHTELNLPSRVYTIGMPRTFRKDAATAYNAALGRKTFRLVHGQDIVATIPPSRFPSIPQSLEFNHVGRLLHCVHNGRFEGLAPSTDFPDKPDPSDQLRAAVLTALPDLFSLKQLLSFPLLISSFIGGAHRKYETLPVPLRDHVPFQYYRAIS